MQSFVDTKTKKTWDFEDDVKVTSNNDGQYFFQAPTGYMLKVPHTLIPAKKKK